MVTMTDSRGAGDGAPGHLCLPCATERSPTPAFLQTCLSPREFPVMGTVPLGQPLSGVCRAPGISWAVLCSQCQRRPCAHPLWGQTQGSLPSTLQSLSHSLSPKLASWADGSRGNPLDGRSC